MPASTVQQQARALGDPTRHALFHHIAAAGQPVGIADLTARFRFNHNAIRQHVAKLVAAGLVVETKATATGPGRPRLMYTIDPAAHGRWGTTGPYERLSQLLAAVISTGLDPEEVGRRSASDIRNQSASGDAVADMASAMARQGFNPEVRAVRGGAEIVLHSCPFESTAITARDAVCSLHLGIADGLAEGTSVVVDELVANDPRRAGCRFSLRKRDSDLQSAVGRLSLRGTSANIVSR
jgi:predicted ArsR family transcriptional regulator